MMLTMSNVDINYLMKKHSFLLSKETNSFKRRQKMDKSLELFQFKYRYTFQQFQQIYSISNKTQEQVTP